MYSCTGCYFSFAMMLLRPSLLVKSIVVVATVGSRTQASQVDLTVVAEWIQALVQWTHSVVDDGSLSFNQHNVTVGHYSEPHHTSLSLCLDSYLLQPNENALHAIHSTMLLPSSLFSVAKLANDPQPATARAIQIESPIVRDCFNPNTNSSETTAVARAVRSDIVVLCGADAVLLHVEGQVDSVYYVVDKSLAVVSKHTKAWMNPMDHDISLEVSQSMQQCVNGHGGALTVRGVVGGGWSVQRSHTSNIVAGYASAFDLTFIKASQQVHLENGTAATKWVRSAADTTATALLQAGQQCHAEGGDGCYLSPMFIRRPGVIISVAAKWEILSNYMHVVVYSGAIVMSLLALLSVATGAPTHRRLGYATITDPIQVDYDSCSSSEEESGYI
ncbi:hypothetical protein DYB38_008575 [Aphanomyces astaci]|uniref:Uncharacterized protein n=1 Tax=Aphanomyces astaci TaxID=112090 RepID=A0A397DVN1_APHAT|nr:hypothetical protein DYB38_008575 [Aphanomyces astaci]RHY77406.1 hypothetical protein DYB34_003238 [Aphanomyces astaci]